MLKYFYFIEIRNIIDKYIDSFSQDIFYKIFSQDILIFNYV